MLIQSLSKNRPIELYKFIYGDRSYTYNSGPKDWTSLDSTLYKSHPIDRNSIQRTNEDYKNTLTIDVPHDNPVAQLFKKNLPSDHVYIEVKQTQRDDPIALKHLFSGEVTQVTWNNATARLICNPASALMRRQVLRMGYHAQCNHHLFDDMCGLRLQDWQEAAIVQSVTSSGTTVQVNSKQNDDGYYIAGLLSTTKGDHRTIVAVDNNTIEIQSPIDDLKSGDVIRISKGCDRSAAACQSFDNYDNFFGCLTIPQDNPFE